MFGYIVPNKMELKGREIEEYRGWYCGLCHQLKKKYGFWGQLSLNYDLTFLSLLLSSLYEPEIQREQHRCMAHPFHSHLICRSDYTEYAGDMNILLTYYQCKDDWKDEHKLLKGSYGLLLGRGAGRVIQKYPKKAERIQECLELLSVEEQNNTSNIDIVAGLFGEICRVIFSPEKDEWTELLEQIGFFLGKFIYLIDAWEDLSQDQQNGCYNPLLEMAKQEDYSKRIQQILQMMLGEACRSFEKLPLLENVDILRNILYSGVWSKWNKESENNFLEDKIEHKRNG